MSKVEMYRFEDEYGTEHTFTTFNATEAREYARRYGLLMLADTYVYDDSEPVEDYRPKPDEEEDEYDEPSVDDGPFLCKNCEKPIASYNTFCSEECANDYHDSQVV